MQETKRTKEHTEVGVREEDEEERERCKRMLHGDSIKQKSIEE